MKTYRRKDGTDALWFEDGEIDALFEAELRRASLFPVNATSAVDIERFIERHLQAGLDQHAELPDDVLGLTEFVTGKQPRIAINKNLTRLALDEDMSPPGTLGRWRATLAHEAAHVILHRSLFDFEANNLALFAEAATAPASKLQRCLKREVTFRPTSDWREVQANQGMAALLMPRSLFAAAARTEIEKVSPGAGTVPAGREDAIAAALAATFEVSKQAARIRLTTLHFVASTGQMSM
jgi:hypothetical protein